MNIAQDTRNHNAKGSPTLSDVLQALESYKLKRAGSGWRSQCPAHGGDGPNLAINFKDEKLLLCCHSNQCTYADIMKALQLDTHQETPQVIPMKGVRLVEYETRDRAGRLVAVQKRKLTANGKKACPPWWETNGKTGLDGRKVNTFPLYGSQRIDSFDPARVIDICEGQPATEALLSVMAQALGTYGTSNEPSKESLSWAKGRAFRLWPDNDPAGAKHMKLMARLLLEAGAAKVLILDSSSLPPKGDAVEWLDEQLFDKQELVEKLKGEEVPGLPIAEIATLPRSGAVVHCMADVKPEKVVWLFENRIPRKNITLLVGDPGLGKSTFTIDLAARVSTGRGLPGEPDRAPENVVYMTWEDGLADTVRPRLEAAGADLSRVHAISGIYEGEDQRGLSFPQDLVLLEAVVKEHKAALIIIDPLMAFLGTKVDSNKDQEIRRVMGGLARIAATSGAAVVVVNHMNKSSGGPALYRGAGSIGIIGSARSALLFAEDPDDKNKTGLRILAPLKSNLGPAPTSLRLQVVGALNGSSMILFKGTASQTADGLTAAQAPDSERGAVDEGTDVLRQILEKGKVRAVDAIKAAREAGVSQRTLERAKGALGVKSTRDGVDGWYWSLPLPLGGLGGVGGVPTTKDFFKTANQEDLGGVPNVGGVPSPTCNDMKAAKTAKTAKDDNPFGGVVSTYNNNTILKTAKTANILQGEGPESPQETPTASVAATPQDRHVFLDEAL